MSLLSKERVVSSHIFIILLNKWVYPAHKLANTFSPCSTCWHFPADGSAEGETRKVVSDKGQACLVTVLYHSETLACLPLSPSQWACWEREALRLQTLLGRIERGRKEVKSAWPLRMDFPLSILNLFISLWVGEGIFTVFFPSGIISRSLCTGDLFLNSWSGMGYLTCRCSRFGLRQIGGRI